MFLTRRRVRIETERLILRQPVHTDYRAWFSQSVSPVPPSFST
jgi:hypothetical protein